MYVLMSIKRSSYMTPPAIELKSDFIHVQHMLLIASDEPYLITRSKVVKIFLYKFCPCCFNITLATLQLNQHGVKVGHRLPRPRLQRDRLAVHGLRPEVLPEKLSPEARDCF